MNDKANEESLTQVACTQKYRGPSLGTLRSVRLSPRVLSLHFDPLRKGVNELGVIDLFNQINRMFARNVQKIRGGGRGGEVGLEDEGTAVMTEFYSQGKEREVRKVGKERKKGRGNDRVKKMKKRERDERKVNLSIHTRLRTRKWSPLSSHRSFSSKLLHSTKGKAGRSRKERGRKDPRPPEERRRVGVSLR